MLGNPVCKQDHVGVPRCVRYRVGFPSIVRWRQVRSPDSRMFSFDDGAGEKFQPVDIGVRVIVDECDHFSSGCLYARITCLTETLVLGAD